MMFVPYPHLERLGKDDVEGICAGDCYIFPKIDGTNGSAWFDNGVVCAGSRNRELSIDSDNRGFYDYVTKDDKIKAFLERHPALRLYGEWLVPHTFKGYREDAWSKFYVFDVGQVNEEGVLELLPYEQYKPLLDLAGIEYIPAIRVINNPSEEELQHELINNFYLCANSDKPGEGIVIKNYEFKNKWGRQTWAKMVNEEFNEKNMKKFGTPDGGTKKVEADIIDKYITKALCEKEYNKIMHECTDAGVKSIIPRTIETIWHTFIVEESYNFVKEFNCPTINFKMLKALCVNATKKNLPQMFL